MSKLKEAAMNYFMGLPSAEDDPDEYGVVMRHTICLYDLELLAGE